MTLELTEITGDEGHYFTIAELRASAVNNEFDNDTKYPDAALETKRDEAEEDFEALAHRAFVPRTATAYGRGGDEYLFLPFRDLRTVTSVTDSDGDAVDIDDVAIDPIIGALQHPSEWPDGILTVTYTHGKDEPPAGVKRAVMLLAKIYAVPSAIDPRATAVVNADSIGYRISVAKGDKSGIPDVDSAAQRYGDMMPAVG